MTGWLLLNDALMVGYAGGLVDRYFNGLLSSSARRAEKGATKR
jgi:hypothetical protein